MTNLIDNTESSGRRLFEPIALVLLAAGGVTAAIARSEGASDEPGLVVPPLTAQAHAEGSPPAAEPAAPASRDPADPNLAPALAIAPVTTKTAWPQPAAVADNRFAEAFAQAGAPPVSLALERPEPAAATKLEAVASTEAASRAALVVPAAAEPAMQLVAIDPTPRTASAPDALAPAVPALAPAGVELASVELASASPAPATVPVAPAAVAVPAAAAVEGISGAALEVAPAAPAPVAPLAAAAPAELVPQTAPAPVVAGPVAIAATPAPPAAPTVAFVSQPIVQAIPAGPAAKPLATPPARADAAPAPPVLKATPPARSGKAKSPRATVIGGMLPSNFQLTDGTIDYRIGARVNGGEPAFLPMRISRDDQLSVKLGDLLALVKPQMDPALYAYLASSRGAEEYVSFAAIRATGIDIRYDAARDQLLLGVE